jgi:hypothetical protein
VEGPKLRDHPVERPLDALLVADVGLDEEQSEFGRGRRPAFDVAVEDRDVGSRLRVDLADPAADALRAARDDRDLSRQPAHLAKRIVVRPEQRRRTALCTRGSSRRLRCPGSAVAVESRVVRTRQRSLCGRLDATRCFLLRGRRGFGRGFY